MGCHVQAVEAVRFPSCAATRRLSCWTSLALEHEDQDCSDNRAYDSDCLVGVLGMCGVIRCDPLVHVEHARKRKNWHNVCTKSVERADPNGEWYLDFNRG